MTRRRIAAPLLAAVALASILAAGPASPASAAEGPDVFGLTIELDVVPGPTSALGTELALTATVRFHGGPLPGESGDNGTVWFDHGGTTIDRLDPDENGRASTSFTPTTAGTYELSASYVPEHYPVVVESEVHEHTVTGEPHVPAVRLFVSPDEHAPAGTELRLTATVKDALEDPRIHGTVVFLDAGQPIGMDALTLYEDVVYAEVEVTLAPGVHELSARYDGNPPAIGRATSRATTYSVLPETCADSAEPGSGALVRLAYQAALRRCPDPDGFAYWTERLDGGTSAAVLGRGLALSSEGIAVTVDDAYRTVLLRPADRAGRAVWAAKLRAGWTTSQLWAALAASPEFIAGAPGDDRVATLVDRAFARVVGRPADEASAAYWYGRLSGARRSSALRALTLTPEALSQVVDDAHRAVLGRAPHSSEHAATQTTIKARRGDWRTVVADLLGAPAAFTHAQTYPDPAA